MANVSISSPRLRFRCDASASAAAASSLLRRLRRRPGRRACGIAHQSIPIRRGIPIAVPVTLEMNLRSDAGGTVSGIRFSRRITGKQQYTHRAAVYGVGNTIGTDSVLQRKCVGMADGVVLQPRQHRAQYHVHCGVLHNIGVRGQPLLLHVEQRE